MRHPRRAAARARPFLDGACLVAGAAALFCLAPMAPGGEPQGAATYEIFVITSDGKPASGAVMRVMGSEEELPPATADERGRVKIEPLKPGEPAFFLAASADGNEKMFVPMLVVPEGRHRMTIRLYPPGLVRGELLDEKGQPAEAAMVRLSGWEWLNEPELEGEARTNTQGQFEIHGLIAGAYYTVTAAQGPAEEPARAWRSSPFTLWGWDGWHDVGILLPEGSEPTEERPAGKVVQTVASGTEDEWYDQTDQAWLPAVETYDPNRAWAPAPEGAIWIWRAGRPDAAAERYGATVEFRRKFAIEEKSKRLVEYLTIAADDYAAIRLNGQWVGQTNQYMRTVGIVVPVGLIRVGENELQLTVRNAPGTMRDFYNPTGVTYVLELIEPAL